MPDFKAALALAKQNLAVLSGYTGCSGNAFRKHSDDNRLRGGQAVTTAVTPVVTVVTEADAEHPCNHSGQPVTTTLQPLVTAEQAEKDEHLQRPSNPVTTATSVTTDFEQAAEISGDPRARGDCIEPTEGSGEVDGPEMWRRKFDNLSGTIAPCPGFASREWLRVFAAARTFLALHAEAAHSCGWAAAELFGVHPVVGATRVDHCGALMVSSGKLVTGVDRDVITFGHLRYQRRLSESDAVLVWEFGR